MRREIVKIKAKASHNRLGNGRRGTTRHCSSGVKDKIMDKWVNSILLVKGIRLDESKSES